MDKGIIDRLVSTFVGAFIGFSLLSGLVWLMKKGFKFLDKILDRLDNKE